MYRLQEGEDIEKAREDIKKAVANWVPKEGADDDELRKFKEKVEIRNEPDPDDQLLVLLANHFFASDPLAKMHEWLGELFNAAEAQGNFTPALKRIWIDLRVLQNSRHEPKSPGHLWSAEDQPPGPGKVEQGPIRIQERAVISDLREGRFADRQIFRKLARKAEEWIEKAPGSHEAGRKLSLFWIGGRSGTGKSIALLHVLAMLHAQENNRFIIWLDNNIDALPECFRWARPLLQDGREVLIGIDDPFPAGRENDLAGILNLARHELSGLRFPLIVCCGPAEQRLSFREQFGHLAAIFPVELPKETADDRALLWDWYQRRTGTKRSQPFSPDQDVLLVQLFFEWWTGKPIGDFASGFRRRIQGLDHTPTKAFEPFMYSLFAVNRLYVNYPIELMKNDHQIPEFEVAFNRLHREESHLTVEEESNRPGVRIAHPHLANAIYESESWFPREPASEPHRRDHLKKVIFRSLEECGQPRDKLAILWAIARLGDPAGDEAARSRLDSATIATLLHDVTTKMQSGFGVLPVYVLPVLIELQARYPSTKFALSPLKTACDALVRQAVNETGFRLLCHKVLQHREALQRIDAATTKRAIQSVRSVLQDKIFWAEWPHIALDYRKTIADPTIDPWIGNWITSHLDHSRTPLFIQDIVEFTQSEDVIKSALAWLSGVDANTPVAPFVLQALLANCKENEPLWSFASSWLDKNDWNQDQWPFVWETLMLALPPGNGLGEHMLTRGREWLDKNDQLTQHPYWPGVLAILIERIPTDTDLRRRGWGWLKEASLDHGAWTFIWEALEKTTRQGWEDRDELISLGRRWLAENSAGESHGAWLGVLAVLINRLPADADLRQRGWGWLKEASLDHGAWTYIWEALEKATRRAGENRDEVISLGRRWLAENSSGKNHGAWPGILARLIKASPNDSDLLKTGWKWIRSSNFANPSWSWLWCAIERTTRGVRQRHRKVLLENGIKWLRSVALTNSGWTFVWEPICEQAAKLDIDTVEVFRLGYTWFDWHRQHPERSLQGWPIVLASLVSHSANDAELRKAAWGWLESATVTVECSAWFGLWRALYHTEKPNSGRGDEFRRLGAKWLTQCSLDDPFFGTNWETVFDLGERSEAFLDLGFGWAKDRIGEYLPSFILPKLFSISTRYDVFLNELVKGLETGDITSELWNIKLIVVLKALAFRQEKIQDKLFLRGCDWLDALLDAVPPLWASIWVQLYEQRGGTADLIRMGEKWVWVKTSQIDDSWASVWLRLTNRLSALDVLIEPAVDWLNVVRKSHNKWPEVWKRLWGRTGDCRCLGPLAVQWLQQDQAWRKQQGAWQEIWLTLWNAGCQQDELQHLKEKRRLSSPRTK